MMQPFFRTASLRTATLRLLRAAGLAAALATWLVASGPAMAQDAARRPLEHYARLPQLAQVSSSPDGLQIAALLNEGEHTAVVTRAAGSGRLRVAMSSDNQKFHFNWVRWVSDERLLVSVRHAARRGFVGTVETRLYSVKADGSGLLQLRQDAARGGSMAGNGSRQVQDDVIDWLPGDGRHVLVQAATEGSMLPAVYRVNVDSGERLLVQAPERGVVDWLTDAQHRVRIGVRADRQGATEIIEREPQGKAWRTLWRFEDAQAAVRPMGFGSDPQELFVKALHEGRWAVFSVRLDDPALPRRLRLAHPDYDVQARLFAAPLSGEVFGLQSNVDGEDPRQARAELWAPEWQALAARVDQALPGRDNRLIDLSHDLRRYLVYSSGNARPGRYYLGDRQTGALTLVGETYPELAAAPLVGKQRLTLQARDGLKLQAFLSLPAGRRVGDEAAPLPLVLLPHGGPHSRDDDDFDSWTEFLADRGYAVLQVNFRGSQGYGQAFKEAGLKRWGLEMQDDLTDAVQWALAQGLADARRVCIVGASYGGYAALMGAVKTPGLYRCVVSFAGVSHLPDLLAHSWDYVGGAQVSERMIGEIWGDRERLRATSPALQAERFNAPVLLVHGSVDRSVPVEQSQTMSAALKRAGKPHRYIEHEGGDHHLSRQSHRSEFFRELEAFLDTHLRAAAH